MKLKGGMQAYKALKLIDQLIPSAKEYNINYIDSNKDKI